MEKLNEGNIVASMAACETEKELRDCKANMMENDAAVTEYYYRRKVYARLKNARSKEIRDAMLAPFDDEAKRMQRGQKVYFGKRCNSVALDWNLRSVKGSEKKIEAGKWCYVWHYQPKAQRLWLCRPGTKCEYKNVIRDHFSLNDMLMYQISRTETKLRK